MSETIFREHWHNFGEFVMKCKQVVVIHRWSKVKKSQRA